MEIVEAERRKNKRLATARALLTQHAEDVRVRDFVMD